MVSNPRTPDNCGKYARSRQWAFRLPSAMHRGTRLFAAWYVLRMCVVVAPQDTLSNSSAAGSGPKHANASRFRYCIQYINCKAGERLLAPRLSRHVTLQYMLRCSMVSGYRTVPYAWSVPESPLSYMRVYSFQRACRDGANAQMLKGARARSFPRCCIVLGRRALASFMVSDSLKACNHPTMSCAA